PDVDRKRTGDAIVRSVKVLSVEDAERRLRGSSARGSAGQVPGVRGRVFEFAGRAVAGFFEVVDPIESTVPCGGRVRSVARSGVAVVNPNDGVRTRSNSRHFYEERAARIPARDSERFSLVVQERAAVRRREADVVAVRQ